MKRNAIAQLSDWKNHPRRKPLVIRGARQVGKTWLMKEFGRQEYENTAYVNFDHNEDMKRTFSGNLDLRRIIKELEIYTNQRILPDKTLIIFDEVQEEPNALVSLKYFAEDFPEYHVVCAGSLLGLMIHEGSSFPVGKVDFMDLHPLSFSEFLNALGKDMMAQCIEDKDYITASNLSQQFLQYLRWYFYVGGMPEAVLAFSCNEDFDEARRVQKNILTAYELDFSKHAPAELVPKIRMLWQSLPAQLSRENKKFLYGLVKEGARAKEYENALLWLKNAGLVCQVQRVTVPHLPLKAYEDSKAFKLFAVDTGLLACMSDLRKKTLIDGDALFTEFKGALTEQYVMQELTARNNYRLFYWSNDRSTNEIDFLADNGEELIPIEVKSGENLMSKSLKAFCEKYEISNAVRTSLSPWRKESWLENIPLWCV